MGLRVEAGYGERSREIAAELAMHFERGRDTERAVRYLHEAGQNAIRRNAPREAIAHIERAIGLLQTFPLQPGLPGRLAEAQTRPVTVEDRMRLRSIPDVRISPDGQRVAYVVSQPSVEKNAPVAVLWVVPVAGGAATRMNYGTRIFNQPRPAPRLRWSPELKRARC